MFRLIDEERAASYQEASSIRCGGRRRAVQALRFPMTMSGAERTKIGMAIA
jgi:hypothetical protein